MLKPGPISASHIISRCIGGDKRILETIENDRINKVNEILENVKQITEELKSEGEQPPDKQNDIENIETIIQGLYELNKNIKKRNQEYISQSQFCEELIEKLKKINDIDELCNFIFDEVLELRTKIQATANIEFKESLVELEESGVLNLIRCFTDENSIIGEKYPFLYDLLEIFNNKLLKSSNCFHIDNFPADSRINSDFYQYQMKKLFGNQSE